MPNALGHLGWLPELRCAQLLGVPRTTLRAWVAAGLLHLPRDGAYRFPQVIEALLIWAIREHVNAKVAANVMARLRRDRLLEEAVAHVSKQGAPKRFDVVIDLGSGSVAFCWNDASLIAAVSDPNLARKVVVQPVAHRLAHILDGFENLVERTPAPSSPRPGRVAATAAPATNVARLRPRS